MRGDPNRQLADLLSAFGYEQIFVQGRDTATGQNVAYGEP